MTRGQAWLLVSAVFFLVLIFDEDTLTGFGRYAIGFAATLAFVLGVIGCARESWRSVSSAENKEGA